MNQILEEIRTLNDKIENFEKKSDTYHTLILATNSRNENNHSSSNATAKTLGITSLWIGGVSFLIIAILEDIISRTTAKILLIIFVFFGLCLLCSYIINVRAGWIHKKKAKEMNSRVLNIVSDFEKSICNK